MGATRGVARIGDDEWVKGQWKHGFMEFIHEVNRRCAEAGIEPVFGEPTSIGDWWVTGMYCEEYPRARVVYTKGPLEERVRRGEGYRIVTDDEELWPMWNEAMMAVEQRIERRDSGDPRRPYPGRPCYACGHPTQTPGDHGAPSFDRPDCWNCTDCGYEPPEMRTP